MIEFIFVALWIICGFIAARIVWTEKAVLPEENWNNCHPVWCWFAFVAGPLGLLIATVECDVSLIDYVFGSVLDLDNARNRFANLTGKVFGK